MAKPLGDQLDKAHDELRAWCHERPDLQDPSTVYGVLGSINAILATLEHIIDLACRSAARATSTDDARTVEKAGNDVAHHGRSAIAALEDAYREVAVVHAIASHLVFAAGEDGSE